MKNKKKKKKRDDEEEGIGIKMKLNEIDNNYIK